MDALTNQLQKLDVEQTLPPAKSWFPCSTINQNDFGPTTPAINPEKSTPGSPNDNNPFYHPRLSLRSAAKYIHNILSAANGACESWLQQPKADVEILATGPEHDNPLGRMCTDFNHILFFLQHGRKGWDLTYLPDDFFSDVEEVVDQLVRHLELLAEIDGCGGLMDSAVERAKAVGDRLGVIKAERLAIYLTSKEEFER